MAGQGGRTLGIARAIIEMATDRFTRSKNVIVKESRQMSKAVDEVGDATDKSAKRSESALGRFGGAVDRARSRQERFNKSFDSSRLDRFQNRLESMVGTMTRISAVAGGITFFGVNEALQAKKIEVTLKALTGDAQKAAAITEDARRLSKEFGTPYQDLLQGAAAFVPVAKQTGVEMERLLLTAQKMLVLNPAASFDDAKFSLKEALGGDFVSIRDRFDLSKSEANYLKEAGDDADELLKRMDEILAKKGVTEETLKEIGTSGVNAFGQLKSAVGEAAATAFTPLLERLIPIVEKFTEFIETLSRTNPELLAMGGALTAAAVAGGPLLTLVTSLIGGLKTVGGLMGGLNFAKLGKIGVLGGAAVGGLEGGRVISQGLADAGIGDQRLRSDSDENFWDVIGERVKQVIVIFIKGLVEVGRMVALFGAHIINAGEQFGNLIGLMLTYVREFSANLTRALADLFLGIDGFLSSIGIDGSAIGNAGLAMLDASLQEKQQIGQDRAYYQQELGRGFTLKPEVEQSINAAFDKTSDVLVGGAHDLLFGANEAADNIEEAANATGGALDALRTAMENAPDPADGEVTFNEDQVKAFEKFEDDIAAIEERAQEQREGAIASHEERKTDMVARYEEQRSKLIADTARQQQRDREKLEKDVQKLIAEGGKAEAKAKADAQDKINEITAKAQEDETKEIDRHEQALADIRKKRRMELLDASRTLDAQAALDAHRRAQEETAQEEQEHATRIEETRARVQEETAAVKEELNKQLQEQQAARQERIAEMRAELAERHQLQQEDNARRLAEMAAQHQAELAKNEEALQKKLAQIDQEAQREAQKREQAFMQEFNQLSTHEANKLKIQQEGQAESEKRLRAWWHRVSSNLGSGGNSKTSSMDKASASAGASASGASVADKLKKSLGLFHTGKDRVRKTGPYTLQEGEMVLPTRAADPIRRLLGANPITKLLQMVEQSAAYPSEQADLIASGREGRQLAIAASQMQPAFAEIAPTSGMGRGAMVNSRVAVNAPVQATMGAREARIAELIQERVPALIEAVLLEVWEDIT